jgi:hypothetical protein
MATMSRFPICCKEIAIIISIYICLLILLIMDCIVSVLQSIHYYIIRKLLANFDLCLQNISSQRDKPIRPIRFLMTFSRSSMQPTQREPYSTVPINTYNLFSNSALCLNCNSKVCKHTVDIDAYRRIFQNNMWTITCTDCQNLDCLHTLILE